MLVPPNRLPPVAPKAGVEDVEPKAALDAPPKSEPAPVAAPKAELLAAAPKAGVAEKLKAGVLEAVGPTPNIAP